MGVGFQIRLPWGTPPPAGSGTPSTITVAGRMWPLQVVRHQRARRYTLRMTGSGVLRLTVPKRASVEARVIYGQTVALRRRDFVVAAGAIGGKRPYILTRHILPQLVPTIIVWGTLGIATNVMLEASLSYLGIGVQPPTPSWGGMIQQAIFLSHRPLAGHLPWFGNYDNCFCF